MSISLTDKAARDVSALGYPAVFPAGSILELYDTVQVAGSAPAGIKIATGTLPSGPWGTQTSRSVPKQNTWTMTGTAAATSAGKNAAGFRLKTAADDDLASQAEARIVGTVGVSGSGADMIVDNVNVATGQVVTVNTFTLGIA